jgi:hypothetical protein
MPPDATQAPAVGAGDEKTDTEPLLGEPQVRFPSRIAVRKGSFVSFGGSSVFEAEMFYRTLYGISKGILEQIHSLA